MSMYDGEIFQNGCDMVMMMSDDNLQGFVSVLLQKLMHWICKQRSISFFQLSQEYRREQSWQDDIINHLGYIVRSLTPQYYYQLQFILFTVPIQSYMKLYIHKKDKQEIGDRPTQTLKTVKIIVNDHSLDDFLISVHIVL